MSSWKKFRSKTYARMLAGDISVEEAWARYNREAARRGKPPVGPAGGAVAKSAGATVRVRRAMPDGAGSLERPSRRRRSADRC